MALAFLIYGGTMISRERATEIAMYVEENGVEGACRHYEIPEETLNRYLRSYKNYIREESIVAGVETSDTTVFLQAQRQKLQDVNGVLRKENRESYRLYNSLETVYSEYVGLLRACPLVDFTIPVHPASVEGRIGVLQISDAHLNELIEPYESNGNTYDFVVGSKRLQKFVTEAKLLFNAYGIKSVYVFCTGDMINSDRRLSEKLVAATSQTRAALLTTYILQQVLIDLAQDYTITFAGVVGNESRLGEEDFDSSDILAASNWDYMIYQQLRMLFEGKAVEFIEAENNVQQVVTLDNGFNALLIHGNYLRGDISDKQISVLLQNYMYRGIPIHGVFCGHIHSAFVGDIVSRSSGLCGGNAYSTNALMFVSRASQNIYIVNPDKGYNGMKIDLQNVDGYEGYNILPQLERYRVRNAVATARVTIETLI